MAGLPEIDPGGLTPAGGDVSPLGLLTASFAAVGSLLIVSIMLLINADVFGRFLFGMPVPIVAEIVSVSIVSVVFLQLADCVRTRRMIQSDMWVSRLMEHKPSIGLALETVHAAVGTVMMTILVWYIYDPVADSFSPTRVVGIYGVLTLPLWPFYLAVLLGAGLALIQYAALTLEVLAQTVRMRREDRP